MVPVENPLDIRNPSSHPVLRALAGTPECDVNLDSLREAGSERGRTHPRTRATRAQPGREIAATAELLGITRHAPRYHVPHRAG